MGITRSWRLCTRFATRYAGVRNPIPRRPNSGRYTAYIPAAYERGYAGAAAPDDNAPVVENAGTESDFSRAVAGKDQAQAWRVVGELMDTLHIVNPRLYESVLRKMQNL